MNKERKPKQVFLDGPVTPEFIAGSIASHASKKDIGAHSIFLGQVRNDQIEGKTVTAIEYTTYQEMALEKFHEIREEAFGKFSLNCMHIYHSLGKVPAGEISLFVFASSTHRKDCLEATRYIVDRIKQDVPIWGMEILEDNSYFWKKTHVEQSE